MLKSQNGCGARLGVYVGHGASHSWTWFADLFDRENFFSVVFLDEDAVKSGLHGQCGVLFVSGGDTFAIAEGLGDRGAQEIKRFVEDGGTYVGACAGAYLVLKSSLEPLSSFNLVQARISNLAKHLPVPTKMPEKYCTEYGCRYVFHPVRDEVVMKVCGRETPVTAPLFGGSAMLPSEDVEVLAEYSGFTDRTEFLTDEETARRTILGNIAAARKRLGRGVLYLFGPHFEHPGYAAANRIIIDIVSGALKGSPAGTVDGNIRQPDLPVSGKEYRRFLSEVSNSRIACLALERASFKWLIGKKVYDPGKIRTFVETVWRRARALEKSGGTKHIAGSDVQRLICKASAITLRLRKLSRTSACALSANHEAAVLFKSLRDLTADFLSMYFQVRQTASNEGFDLNIAS